MTPPVVPRPGDRIRLRRPGTPPRRTPQTIWHVTDVPETAWGPLVIAAPVLPTDELDDHPWTFWPDEWTFCTPTGDPLPPAPPTLWETLPDPDPDLEELRTELERLRSRDDTWRMYDRLRRSCLANTLEELDRTKTAAGELVDAIVAYADAREQRDTFPHDLEAALLALATPYRTGPPP